MSKNVVFKFFIVLSLFLSSFVFYARTADAELYEYYSNYNVWMPGYTKLPIPKLQGSNNSFDPSSSHWLYPSTRGGNTDLYLYIEAETIYQTGEYMVYLQRAINGSWVTVGHAGFPRNGTKTVYFTREYNTSYLYSTTPYRFVIDNNSSSGMTIGAVVAY